MSNNYLLFYCLVNLVTQIIIHAYSHSNNNYIFIFFFIVVAIYISIKNNVEFIFIYGVYCVIFHLVYHKVYLLLNTLVCVNDYYTLLLLVTISKVD